MATEPPPEQQESGASETAAGPSVPPTAERESNRRRFEIELEFVQALGNPYYLETLAQRGFFQQESFINYLKYLQYWRERKYVRFIAFPQALHHLELLQHESFRNALSRHDVIVAIEKRQYQHWRIWRNDPRLQPRLGSVAPPARPPPKVSITTSSAVLRPMHLPDEETPRGASQQTPTSAALSPPLSSSVAPTSAVTPTLPDDSHAALQ